MFEAKPEQETTAEKETARLEAFSDGVFAVAITLLAFDLTVPSIGKDISSAYLVTQLLAQWPSYLAFFISFATILIMWVSHHNLFKLIQRSSTPFMFANGFLLLLVTVVPFPTHLVAEYLTTSAATPACVVYCGLFVFINLAYNILWWLAAYRHHLLKSSVSRALIKMRTCSYLLGIPSYLLATALAFWNPFASVGICSLLWLFWAYASYEREPIASS